MKRGELNRDVEEGGKRRKRGEVGMIVVEGWFTGTIKRKHA